MPLEAVCDDEVVRGAVLDGVADAGVTVAVLRCGLSCALGFGFSSTVTLEGVAGGVGLEDTEAGLGVEGGFALPVFGVVQAESRAENINVIEVRASPGDISPRILTPEVVSDQDTLNIAETAPSIRSWVVSSMDSKTKSIVQYATNRVLNGAYRR